MKTNKKTLALGMVLLLTLSAVGGVYLVSAQPDESTPPEGKGRREEHLIELIGEEAAQALIDTVEAMREAGSTREEIHEYVQGYLAELGVELPEPKGKGHHNGWLVEQIGEEAAQALHDTVQAMREEGATHEEIREYVDSYLEELGVERPEPPMGKGNHEDRLIELIGEEAAQEIQDTVEEMKEAGATREEIREYVDSALGELGVERPEPKGEGQMNRKGKGPRQGNGMGRKGPMGRRGNRNQNGEAPPAEVPTSS